MSYKLTIKIDPDSDAFPDDTGEGVAQALEELAQHLRAHWVGLTPDRAVVQDENGNTYIAAAIDWEESEQLNGGDDAVLTRVSQAVLQMIEGFFDGHITAKQIEEVIRDATGSARLKES